MGGRRGQRVEVAVTLIGIQQKDEIKEDNVFRVAGYLDFNEIPSREHSTLALVNVRTSKVPQFKPAATA